MAISERRVLSVGEIRAAFAPILRAGGAQKAVLYGSYARGDADRYSDIDLIVVAETERPFVDRFEDFRQLLRCFPQAVEILVYTPKEFQQMSDESNPFVERVLKEGVVIYEAQ